MVYHLSAARIERSPAPIDAPRVERRAHAPGRAPDKGLRDRPLRAIWRLDPVTRRLEMYWTYDTRRD